MTDDAERNVKLEAAKELLRRKKLQKECQEDLLSFIRHTHPSWEDAPHHRLFCDWLMKLESQEIDKLAIFTAPRHGKKIADCVQVFTADGWKTHGDLKVGDEVFHPSGKLIKVLATTPKTPVDVKLTLSTGEVIYCHEDHEWKIYNRQYGKRGWEVVETKHFLRQTKFGNQVKLVTQGRCVYQLPPIEPLDPPEKDYILPPYILGAWLGDGSTTKPVLSYDQKDKEVCAEFALHFEKTSTQKHKVSECKSSYFSGLLPFLKKAGVLGDKHIPEIYKLGSKQQRLDLLAGLIDTDGSVCKKTGRTRFINANKRLVDDVCDIIRSFGWRASVHCVPPTLSTSGVQGMQDIYYVGFQPTIPIPHRLKRKRLFKMPIKRRIGIKNAERVSGMLGQCIQVDAEDGLYLVGRGLVPTHNSEIVSRRFPAWCMGRHPDWEMICVQTNGELARDMGANVRDIIGSRSFQDVFPNVKLRADAKAAGRWLVQDLDNPIQKNGIYQSAGITGSVIGKGANLLNIDDPLDAAGAASPRIRNVAADFYFKDCRPRLMTPGLELLTTTRRHEDGLEGRILPPEEKWELVPGEEFVYKAVVSEYDYADPIIWYIIKLPAIINEGTDEERALWPGTDKVRFPLPRLKAIRGDLLRQRNAQEWYAQYQQEVSPEEGNFCKREWFEERYDIVPEELWVFATSDVAVTEEKPGTDPDYTEHCIFGLEGLQIEYDHEGQRVATADYCYILDWWYGKTTADEWIQEFIRLYKLWKPQTWFGTRGVIKNSVEKYLERELRQNHVYCRLEWLSDGKDKAAKGRAMQGMASSRRILFPKKTWAERVIQNACTFPNAMHDDAYDTLCNAIRAMGDIPEAFLGAPVKQTKQPVDSYEEIRTDSYSNWKTV